MSDLTFREFQAMNRRRWCWQRFNEVSKRIGWAGDKEEHSDRG